MPNGTTVQQTQAVSPAQRAQAFAQMTRQHLLTRPYLTGQENNVVTFSLDKVRLTSKILLLVEGSFKVTHAANSSFTPKPFAPFDLIRSINVEINNGFKPFTLNGREAYWYNLAQENAKQVEVVVEADPADVPARGLNYLSNAASSSGTTNYFRMTIDLSLTLNERDPIGLILTQNEETLVTVSLSFGSILDMFSVTTGYTVSDVAFTITPVVQSYSVPPVQSAFPDISILKLVQSTRENIPGSGKYTLKLPVGLTYRKLLFYVEDTSGAGLEDTDLSGNIELVLNGADFPYQVAPKMLATQNALQFGTAMPAGLYVFDFSYQGTPNYGGARDYIDTERLTELWLNVNTNQAGYITAVYELLSRLRATA